MHFVQLKGALVNVAAIESVVDKPGSTATLTFIGGRTLDIPDVTAREIFDLLKKKGMILA
jgi:hypothetical protein